MQILDLNYKLAVSFRHAKAIHNFTSMIDG